MRLNLFVLFVVPSIPIIFLVKWNSPVFTVKKMCNIQQGEEMQNLTSKS